MPQSYDSAQAAAQAALKDALGESTFMEYGGVVYQRDGKFYYTEPETSGDTKRISIKVSYPKGSTLVGLYHTHPETEHSQYFSDSDIDTAKELDLPYYMGHAKDGSMFVFDPDKSEVKKGRIGGGRGSRRIRYSAGSPLEVPTPPPLPQPTQENPLDTRTIESPANTTSAPTRAGAGHSGTVRTQTGSSGLGNSSTGIQ